jgi:hypothetical protein
MGALGAVSDGAGLHHVAEQAQVGQVEAHIRLRIWRRMAIKKAY